MRPYTSKFDGCDDFTAPFNVVRLCRKIGCVNRCFGYAAQAIFQIGTPR
jgi:hypothetical protein